MKQIPNSVINTKATDEPADSANRIYSKEMDPGGKRNPHAPSKVIAINMLKLGLNANSVFTFINAGSISRSSCVFYGPWHAVRGLKRYDNMNMKFQLLVRSPV